MDEFHFAWPFLIPIVAIIGAFTYAVVQTLARARVRELEVRERIAMIERGLVPPPEVDPRGFDRAMDRYERYRERSPGRHRRAGVTLMGVGFGLMLLIGVAGDSMSSGIGVGGFLVVMGMAFFINSLLETRRDDDPPPSPHPNSSPMTPAGSMPEPPRRHE
jgi:Flp pilus assembly protein TadB